MSSSRGRNRERPGTTRDRVRANGMRDRVPPQGVATPRSRNGRRRPENVDVNKSTTSLFTRPTTPSANKQNGHTKTPQANGHAPAMEDMRRRSASVDDRGLTNTSSAPQESEPDMSRPTYQFKIGLGVGFALGECFLQVTRLESAVLNMNNVSDEIRDFMNFLQESIQGADASSPPRDAGSAGDDDERGDATVTPFQQVVKLNDALERSQHDCNKRMASVMKGLKQLQMRLEEMDQVNTKLTQQNARDVDNHVFRQELEKARAEAAVLRRQASESQRNLEETKAVLATREAQLDSDAEAIERQSEHLRADTERLLKEKEDVRRQKDNWQALIEEQKELKEQLNRREHMLNESQKQLIGLQNTLAQKEAHLHRKAKKLRGRERRINQNLMSLRPQGSSYAGSDYAASEASSKLTYFSDGDTEIQSVNSLESDDDDMDPRGYMR